MNFRVYGQQGHEDFSGSSRYTFAEEGFLVVHAEDGRKLTFSYWGWTKIEQQAPPEAGA